jgi:hypothetical protein
MKVITDPITTWAMNKFLKVIKHLQIKPNSSKGLNKFIFIQKFT